MRPGWPHLTRMSKLVFLGDKFGGRAYELAAEKTTVGRGDKNTLTIHDESVSGAHCEILANGPEVIVHDLGSANGTFVNGVQVNGQRQLKHGQVVRFGLVEARLELDARHWDDTATSEQTAVHAMGKIMAEQRRERENPKPKDVSMTLDSGAAGEGGDHTVVLKRPASIASAPVPQAPTPATNSPSLPPPALRLVVAVVVVVGLALLLCWLVWWRK